MSRSIFSPSFSKRILLPLLLVVFVAFCVAYNIALPLFEAPDEGAHYIYVDYIASHHTLPSMDELVSLEVSQPPLYYALGAPLIAWIDRNDFNQVYRTNPGLDNGIVNDHGNKESEFPPTGVTLAMRILRLFSTMLGVLTVIFVYGTVRTIFARDDVALLALAVTAFNPKFIHMSSQFNNDIAVAVSAAFSLWVAAQLMVNDHEPRRLHLIVLGASVGIAFTSKYSGMALGVPAAFAVIWCAVKHGAGGFRKVLRNCFIWGTTCSIGFLVTGGWLLGYNMIHYGNPLAVTQFQHAHSMGIRPVPLSLVDIVDRIPKIISSYWGEFGHGVQFPSSVDLIMFVVVALVVVGVVVAAFRKQLPAFVSLLVVAFVVTFGAFLVWLRNQTGTENSRLLSPAFTTVSAFTAIGILAWLPPRHWGAGANLLSIICIGGGIGGLVLGLLPGYPRPTYLTESQVSALSQHGIARFDNGLELVSVSVGPGRIVPGQELYVSAYWRATQPITDVYRAVVEVYDEQDRILGRMSTLPLQDRYATTQLEPNRVFQDDYRVMVGSPDSGATQRGVADVFLGWYQQRSPNRISHVEMNSAASVKVGQVKIEGQQPPLVNAGHSISTTLGEIVRLEGYDVASGRLTLYWRDIAVSQYDYTVFIHVLDRNGRTIANADGPIAYAMPYWDPGEQIVDIRPILELDQAVAIQLGLYDPANGQRLPARREDGTAWPDDAIILQLR